LIKTNPFYLRYPPLNIFKRQNHPLLRTILYFSLCCLFFFLTCCMESSLFLFGRAVNYYFRNYDWFLFVVIVCYENTFNLFVSIYFYSISLQIFSKNFFVLLVASPITVDFWLVLYLQYLCPAAVLWPYIVKTLRIFSILAAYQIFAAIRKVILDWKKLSMLSIIELFHTIRHVKMLQKLASNYLISLH
jgi:hypothetical protein